MAESPAAAYMDRGQDPEKAKSLGDLLTSYDEYDGR
jgi:hypothetical protein